MCSPMTVIPASRDWRTPKLPVWGHLGPQALKKPLRHAWPCCFSHVSCCNEDSGKASKSSLPLFSPSVVGFKLLTANANRGHHSDRLIVELMYTLWNYDLVMITYKINMVNFLSTVMEMCCTVLWSSPWESSLLESKPMNCQCMAVFNRYLYGTSSWDTLYLMIAIRCSRLHKWIIMLFMARYYRHSATSGERTNWIITRRVVVAAGGSNIYRKVPSDGRTKTWPGNICLVH
jgi:hypothetical protein